jgi:SAM-dependent methyltransferase
MTEKELVGESLEAQVFRLKNELHEAQVALAAIRDSREDAARAEVLDLEHIISTRMGALPLPSEELRLHVGTRTTASNFLLQGWHSSRKVLKVFGKEPEGPILDWGCGSGRTLRWLLEYPKWRQNYRGTDVDAEAISWLESRGIKDVTVCSDETIHLPYANDELSGLFCFSVLTHIHPDKFRPWFEEIARILKPGSLAYLTFNGDTITQSPVPSHAAPAQEFLESGSVWIEQAGNYKSAAFMSHERIRKEAEGVFVVEDVIARDYNTMDAMYARVI